MSAGPDPDLEYVYLTVTVNIPGKIYKRTHAQWPAADEPIPHGVAVAKILGDLAEEIAE